jgi:hypothetical protein
LRFLDPSGIRVTAVPGSSVLRIQIEDQCTVLCGKVRRAFPSSNPGAYYSVQDSEGKELGLLESLEGLDAASREAVLLHLDRRYFTPKIQEVLNLRQDGGMWHFSVRTHRGAAKFYVRNWRDSCHEVRPGQWILFSVDGQRYEIPHWESLSERSRALLEQLF